MDRPVPGLVRNAFLVHVVVAVITGVSLILAPTMMGAAFGYPEAPADLIPVLRSFGAMLLAFGGLTSFLALRAKSWDRVEIIVQSEIVYLAFTLVLYVIYLATGAGPVFGNLFYLVLHVIMLALFYLGWTRRPA